MTSLEEQTGTAGTLRWADARIPSARLRWPRLPESGQVVLIDEGTACVDEGGNRSEAILGPLGVQPRRAVVVQIIQHAEADHRHGVGFLRNGGDDDSFLDPVESVGIG